MERVEKNLREGEHEHVNVNLMIEGDHQNADVSAFQRAERDIDEMQMGSAGFTNSGNIKKWNFYERDAHAAAQAQHKKQAGDAKHGLRDNRWHTAAMEVA